MGQEHLDTARQEIDRLKRDLSQLRSEGGNQAEVTRLQEQIGGLQEQARGHGQAMERARAEHQTQTGTLRDQLALATELARQRERELDRLRQLEELPEPRRGPIDPPGPTDPDAPPRPDAGREPRRRGTGRPDGDIPDMPPAADGGHDHGDALADLRGALDGAHGSLMEAIGEIGQDVARMREREPREPRRPEGPYVPRIPFPERGPPGPPGVPGPPGAPAPIVPQILAPKVDLMKQVEDRNKALMKRSGKKRVSRKTVHRNAYMEARRQATAERRKEKANLTKDAHAKVAKTKRGLKGALKKKLLLDIKNKWALFKKKFPHVKKIKTEAAIRKLTEEVKTFRLRL